jgi:hypothetical protein
MMSTQAQSVRHRCVKVVGTVILTGVLTLVAGPVAMAGPGCPNQPGVCPGQLA